VTDGGGDMAAAAAGFDDCERERGVYNGEDGTGARDGRTETRDEREAARAASKKSQYDETRKQQHHLCMKWSANYYFNYNKLPKPFDSMLCPGTFEYVP